MINNFAMLRRVRLGRVWLALLIATCIPAGLSLAAPAQSRFDGAWSVLIITDAGDCDRAYRYGVQIAGGRVFYEGGGTETQGRVSNNGQVTVSIRQGDGNATGSGRLSGNSGGGQWRGASATGRCSGHWQAQRR